MLNNISQIYIIINKEKENDRYIYLEEWFKNNNIKNYKYFEYCYKDNIKEDDIKKYYKEDKHLFLKRIIHYVIDCNRYKLTLSEISLAINHIKILNEIVENNYENVLILESDAIFSDNLIDKWNNLYLKQLPEQWDVLILGSGNNMHKIEVINNVCGIKLERDKYIYENPVCLTRCSEAMLYSLNACKKIIQTIIPFSAPIDHEFDFQFLENNLKVYLCEPPLVLNGTEIHKYKSTIVDNKLVDKLEYPHEFYSQIGQDKYYIENIINYKKDGVFLDIGAHDGITFSNTYYLEKHLNWKGVCVEPNPNVHNKCIKNRNSIVCKKAIFERSNEKLTFIIPCGNQHVDGGLDQLCGLKGFIREKYLKNDFCYAYSQVEEIVVETININELLDQYNMYNIDLIYNGIDQNTFEKMDSAITLRF